MFSIRESKGGGSTPLSPATLPTTPPTQVKPMLGGDDKKSKKPSKRNSPLFGSFQNKFTNKGNSAGKQAREDLKDSLAQSRLEQPYPIPGLNGRMLFLLIMVYIVYKWIMLLFSKKSKYLFGKTYLAKKEILDVLLMIPHIVIYGFALVAVLRNWRPLALLGLFADIVFGFLIFLIKYRII